MKSEENIIYIQQCAELAHRLINELHKSDPDNLTFNQGGLLDGRDTVFDYISYNEFGIALEHLLYMIHESDIKFDIEQVIHLHALANLWGIENHYTRDNLIKHGVLEFTFNVPDN